MTAKKSFLRDSKGRFTKTKPITNKKISKLKSSTNMLNAKTDFIKSKMKYQGQKFAQATQKRIQKRLKLEQQSKLPGIKGHFARRSLEKNAASNAKIKIMEAKPDLYRAGQETTIQTDANVKMEKAKTKKWIGTASALGSAYGVGKQADSVKESKQADADRAAAEAIKALTEQDIEVSKNPGSVAGLVTGVR